MVSVTEHIVIDRPADEVFAFIGNYENDPKWRADVFEMWHDPPGEAQVGITTRGDAFHGVEHRQLGRSGRIRRWA